VRSCRQCPVHWSDCHDQEQIEHEISRSAIEITMRPVRHWAAASILAARNSNVPTSIRRLNDEIPAVLGGEPPTNRAVHRLPTGAAGTLAFTCHRTWIRVASMWDI
jgi:hypothetical protein